MSGWVGLREDRREGEVLATLILQWLPDKPCWCFCEQARSHEGSSLNAQYIRTEDRVCERDQKPARRVIANKPGC